MNIDVSDNPITTSRYFSCIGAITTGSSGMTRDLPYSTRRSPMFHGWEGNDDMMIQLGSNPWG
ncbi:hypothetical protein BDV27DRAFT_132633 [Aspergillus caelatus]|uniref:Uncharacterized protein n=1 Tax=Aspergillus caelatus TaxID=61420 RepID=A0A5N6ZWF6_9EURO|nr:uncharacterized protein BDV27DRAFT_132633 [Aspergillus caelatus]KAE8361698.1 hypothetical protein BDV27DRAFT_132633 [Aspergillus caelatus]